MVFEAPQNLIPTYLSISAVPCYFLFPRVVLRPTLHPYLCCNLHLDCFHSFSVCPRLNPVNLLSPNKTPPSPWTLSQPSQAGINLFEHMLCSFSVSFQTSECFECWEDMVLILNLSDASYSSQYVAGWL